MTEAEVEALLGSPAERRARLEIGPWPSSSREGWAYGVRQVGGFAFGGIVFFDSASRVSEVHSPVRGPWVHLPSIPWSEVATPNKGGLACHLEALALEPLGIHGEISLKNVGPSDFRRLQPMLPVAFDVVVELFDSEKILVARDSLTKHFSPYSPDETELVIRAGGSVSEQVHLGFEEGSYFGNPPPGVYWVRVAFPLDAESLAASEPVRFEVSS